MGCDWLSGMFPKRVAAIVGVLLCVAACSGESRERATPQEKFQQASAGSLASAPGAATISGTVQLQGAAPSPSALQVTPECQAKHPGTSLLSQEVVVNSSSQLSNVLVYIKDYKGPVLRPRDPISIENDGCQIAPHVTAAMVGQEVKFRNREESAHGLRVSGGGTDVVFDASESGVGAHVFRSPQLMMQVHCDAHPSEMSFLSILPNPFFSVTGSDGGYAITGLPPGTYTLEAVHEKYGVIDQQVTVGPGESKPVAFVFKTG